MIWLLNSKVFLFKSISRLGRSYLREPLINSTIPSVFHGHGDPGLISANVDGFTRYFWGRNPRRGRLQTQFTCQA
ncbi:MAG: hypothetical protein ING09_19620 [Roseomonas sp.]|nr:hypothetical protein [Roseomonas sp.]MCA3291807.1 hypothetical protein [Roseomonas sp.]MCA3296143.1 hypothetical protein [Roseomonas sp.]